LSSRERSAKPFELLFDQKQIARKVEELGKRITADYAGQTIVLVGILKGCVVFLSDLMRSIELGAEISFVSAASYRHGTRRDDEIDVLDCLDTPIKGRHVLIVDGIVDSARTVSRIIEVLRKQEPASLEIVTLLDKPASHRSKVQIKYRGFVVGNEFVIGYGLDNMQKYRNLPFVGRLIDR